MRPATAISADGPMNLLNAVRIAADKDAAGHGVMVALNDEIDGARDVTKTNTTSLSTFKSPTGPLGYVYDGTPTFCNTPIRLHTVKSEFRCQQTRRRCRKSMSSIARLVPTELSSMQLSQQAPRALSMQARAMVRFTKQTKQHSPRHKERDCRRPQLSCRYGCCRTG